MNVVRVLINAPQRPARIAIWFLTHVLDLPFLWLGRGNGEAQRSAIVDVVTFCRALFAVADWAYSIAAIEAGGGKELQSG